MPIDESTIQKAFAEKLVKDFGYRKDVVQMEYPVRIGSHSGRADVVILYKNAWATQEEIFFIAEIKKAGASRDEAYKQLTSYISASLNCRYGALVIGNVIEYFAVEAVNGRKTLKAIITLPTGYGTQHDYGSTTDRLQLEDSSPSAYVSQSTYRPTKERLYLHDSKNNTEFNQGQQVQEASKGCFMGCGFLLLIVIVVSLIPVNALAAVIVFVLAVIVFLVLPDRSGRGGIEEKGFSSSTFRKKMSKEEREFIVYYKDQGMDKEKLRSFFYSEFGKSLDDYEE